MCLRRITEQWNSLEEIGYIMNQAIDVLGIVLTSGKTHLQYVNTKLIPGEQRKVAASRALVCVSPRMFHSVICE